jgi:hypothetical protein
MKYIISEEQLDTVFGMYSPNDFLYYKNLAEPFRFKRQFMKKYPKEYYLAKKAGILDDLKDWDVVNNFKRDNISEQNESSVNPELKPLIKKYIMSKLPEVVNVQFMTKRIGKSNFDDDGITNVVDVLFVHVIFDVNNFTTSDEPFRNLDRDVNRVLERKISNDVKNMFGDEIEVMFFKVTIEPV